MKADLKSDRIEWPTQDGFYHVHLTKEGGKDAGLVYADPGTGKVFGTVQQDMFTGIVMWQLKARARKKSTRKKANAAVAA